MDLIKIHVIDDDERTLSLFAQMETVYPDMLLSMDSNARSGRERLQKERPHIIVISLNSPEIQGADLLFLARKLHPSTPVMVTTSQPSIDSAVQFTKKGASNYLAKPLDFEQEVESQRFRMDLYHRIHVASVNLPPLRERTKDILLLANHFLKMHAQEMNRSVPELAPCAEEMLKIYPWPGNVRELENVMKRTLAMHHSDRIKIAHLPKSMVKNHIAKSLMDMPASGFFEQRNLRMAAFEKQYLEQLLIHCKGDISKAMEEAKLPRGTLYRLLKKCELDPACFR